MTLRQFLLSTQTASAERRAEAAAALGRAYCYGNLAPEAASEAKTGLLSLLDDGSTLVRRAMAESCASSEIAPRPLIVALASDQPDIACLVLARSPVLTDADLVDCAAIGCETTRSAIAGRADISMPVAAALAEVAGAPSLIVLARNDCAKIGSAALLRMVERHGDDAVLREALLACRGVGIEVRHAIAGRVAEALSSFGLASGWLSRERGERVQREARDCAALALSDEAGESGLARLVSHLRAQGQLNAGLILRAILSQRMPFVEAALADLSGLSRARVAGLMFEPRGGGFAALHRRAGLPSLLLPAIQAALSAWREAATGGADIDGARLSRRMIERALTACEDMPFAESRGLMGMLARFEAEAAREEAREHARSLAAEAERGAILRVEADERRVSGFLPEAVALSSPQPAPVVIEAVTLPLPEPAPEPDRLARVLDELPDAILASYHAERERHRDAAANSVLDGLSDALLASFLADRHFSTGQAQAASVAPIVAVTAAAEPAQPLQAPMLVAVPTREPAAQAAPDLVESLISESILASYRSDRERIRLAA